MLLGADSGLDDDGVESVGDQADDEVMLGELSIQSLVVGHIQRDGSGILNAGRQGPGGLQGPAGHGDGDTGLGEDIERGSGDEPRTQHQHSREDRWSA